MARSNGMAGDAPLRTPGILESLQHILRAITEYILVRFELAGLESKSAFQKLGKALAAFVVALLCLAVGFFYLSLSLVYVLAEKAAWGWGYALLASGGVMLVVMLVGLLCAKKFLRGVWFPTTISELKKDTEWLKQNTTPNA
jgi:uncharacterized membrane protein YqjE